MKWSARVIPYLSFLILLLMAWPAGAVRLDLGLVSGLSGADVTIPITLTYEGATPNISATSSDIGFDAAVLANPRAVIGPAGTVAVKNVVVSSPLAGLFRVALIGLNQNILQDGIVVFVTFTVNAGVPPGTITLTNTPSATDPAGNPVVVLGSPGTIQLPLFGDVPAGHPMFNHIMALFNSGISGGCSTAPALFCPDAAVTRAQMAVFIVTSLGRPSNVCSGAAFTDVNAASVGDAVCGFIERLAADGITGGCGSGRYCPNAPVTRGEMAVFIESALGNPPNVATGRFTDVPADHPFCGFVERLTDDGITAGCGAGKYCVDDPITRAQMAVFLVAAPTPLNP